MTTSHMQTPYGRDLLHAAFAPCHGKSEKHPKIRGALQCPHQVSARRFTYRTAVLCRVITRVEEAQAPPPLRAAR